MPTVLTSKCQVTIPKKIRDTLGLGPGSQDEIDLDQKGLIVLRKVGAAVTAAPRGRDRFDRARGRATVKWKTEDLMRLLRGDE